MVNIISVERLFVYIVIVKWKTNYFGVKCNFSVYVGFGFGVIKIAACVYVSIMVCINSIGVYNIVVNVHIVIVYWHCCLYHGARERQTREGQYCR